MSHAVNTSEVVQSRLDHPNIKLIKILFAKIK